MVNGKEVNGFSFYNFYNFPINLKSFKITFKNNDQTVILEIINKNWNSVDVLNTRLDLPEKRNSELNYPKTQRD